MTKAEFVDKLADKLNKRKKEAAEILEAVLESIEESLKAGEKVQLIPFGNFEVRERKAREGRNPRTGEKIAIEGRKVATFTPGKGLRDLLS